MFLDELQLHTEMEGPANAAAADPSRDVSFEEMILGLLTKQILPDATVLGFSRSGSFINREFLNGKSKVYSIEELSWEDVETFVKKTTESEELREKILQRLREISRDLNYDILFLKQIVKIAHKGKSQLGEITTATDLFLTIIRGNLDYQNSKTDSGFTRLPAERQDNLKKLFKLCKENLQNNQEGQTEQAGVIRGTIEDEETWVSDSELDIPLPFLKSVGIFEIPPPSYDELTLTAQHLSFIEFFAAAGILLSLDDIMSELQKIKNKFRFKAVSVYISELLRKDDSSASGLLKNFQRFLKLTNSELDDCQQRLYTAVICRPRAFENYSITLIRTDNTEVKVAAEPLLSCVRGSRIPIRDIITIKAKLEIEDWMWDIFSLLTSGGAVIQEIQCKNYLEEIHCISWAVYSPVIHDLIKGRKLLKLR